MEMPLLHVTVPEGSLSDARKQLMVEKITAATLEAEGLPDNERTRMLTWVIINEVKDGNWGAGGGVVRLEDIARAFGITRDTPRAPEPVAAS
jgi:phenylpyruvate tautomerase PptA (4-oxalocrotonate tautomerase family)